MNWFKWPLCLAVCAALELSGSAAGPKSLPPPTNVLREWTDTDGRRSAPAQLLRVDGKRAWLRAADGRLATTPLARLSEADRRYALSALVLREWTEAKSQRKAQAALLRIDGEQVWLRGADGTLVTTSIDRLSDADRQYLQLRPDAKWPATAGLPGPDPDRSWMQQLSDSIPNIEELAERLVSPARDSQVDGQQSLDDDREAVPATLVYARVSREFLANYVERNVRQQSPVSDSILGTRLVGESYTTGKLHLVLHPSTDRALVEMVFRGTVRARTVGYNGPAVLHNVSESRSQAQKQIFLSDSGLSWLPARSVAQTRSTTLEINSQSPGMRGRIVERVAWRRAAESRPQADAIASQRVAARVGREFDQRVNSILIAAEQKLKSQVQDLPFDRASAPPLVHFRSTPNHVDMVVYRSGASLEELQMQPPAIAGNPDIAVRVHYAVVRRAVLDPKLHQRIRPLLAKLTENRQPPLLASARQAPLRSPYELNWSADRNWLAFDYTKAERLHSEGLAVVGD